MSFVRICDLKKEPAHHVQEPAITYSFPLDIFQTHAISAIDQQHNVLVCAKTGSGKTLVAEYAIAHAIRQGKRVFYTTPIKSLSNQKFHDLKAMWPLPGQVGIMTGDIKFCPDAQIVIMTTEILRNLLYKKGSSTEHVGLTASLSLQELGAVVFDECHYINDRDRGSVWEETMILLPKNVQLIMLSATLDQPEVFADWIGELKETPCHVIQTQYRVVPLTHNILQGDKLVPIMDAKEQFYDTTYTAWLKGLQTQEKAHEAFQQKVKAERRAGFEGAVSGKVKPVSFQHRLSECIRFLERESLLPALVFSFSRKGCESLAAKTESTLLDTSDQAAAANIFDFHLRHHKKDLETLPQYHTIRSLASRGIAFHHSGLLPLLKEAIELLFTKGYIKLLYCTETFAVGINMPTKTVVFTSVEKRDDSGFRYLRTDEYIQMAGRAGRRGKDTQGVVIYLPERDPAPTGTLRAILTGGKPKIESRMTFHYEFLLKTFQAKETKWLDILEKSYWFKQHKRIMDADRKSLVDAEARLAQTSVPADFLEAKKEQDALEQAIRQGSQKQRKDSQRRLERWKEEHSGTKWTLAQQQYDTYKEREEAVRYLKGLVTAAETYTDGVEEHLAVLREFGYLNAENTLTPKGVIATEFNEGHAILCTDFFEAGHAKSLTAEELVALFACFIDDSEKEDMPSLGDMDIPESVKASLRDLDSIVRGRQETEERMGVFSPTGYWNLSTLWIEPIWRWLQGDHIAAICQEYSLFEGNVVRAILRVTNLVQEATSVATLRADLETLQKLDAVREKLVRDIVVPDSLYLHL